MEATTKIRVRLDFEPSGTGFRAQADSGNASRAVTPYTWFTGNSYVNCAIPRWALVSGQANA